MMKVRIAIFVSAVIAVFCFFQFWYPYHFFYHEQNQIFLWEWEYISGYCQRSGGLAALAGDFLTQFYYYLYAGATILTLCIALAGWLMYKTLTNLRVNRWLALGLGLGVMALLTICHFSTSYHLSSTISMLGWLLFLWAASMVRGGWLRLSGLLIVLLPAYLLFGTPEIKHLKAPDFVLEKDFAVDNEYRFGNYDKVLDIVSHSDGWTQQMLFFYNLVHAQRGQLPDHLFDFTPNNLGTFEKIGPDTPRLTIINMNELYWALGDMTFTERAAMMTNVFAPDNRNVRMMKRLAECCLVSGDSIAARKYLRLLSKTFVYGRWADEMQGLLAQGQLPPHLARKVPFVNHRDTITVSDNAHFLMMQLLDHNPDNSIALDYILCSDLLLKDIVNFKRDYDRYCANKPRLKPLYQEALCIWLAGSGASQEEWQVYIKMNDVMQRFIAYNNQRGNPAFKGTYWYYFDKIKAPEI
mgnify:FL=1